MNTQQPPNQISLFQLDSEFRAEFRLLLEEPCNNLCLVDLSGALFGISDSATMKALNVWLSNPMATIRIATFRDEHIINSCHNFRSLMQTSGSQIQWRIMPSSKEGQIQQSFALSRDRLVKKPVRTAFHGFVTTDADDILRQLDYFEQIWEISENAPPLTPLGL
jgi:hypothetical protein